MFLNILPFFALAKDRFYLIISLTIRALIFDMIGLFGLLLCPGERRGQSRNYLI
jgi:hypothetical protein